MNSDEQFGLNTKEDSNLSEVVDSGYESVNGKRLTACQYVP